MTNASRPSRPPFMSYRKSGLISSRGAMVVQPVGRPLISVSAATAAALDSKARQTMAKEFKHRFIDKLLIAPNHDRSLGKACQQRLQPLNTHLRRKRSLD